MTQTEVIDLMKKKQGNRTGKDFAAELGIVPSYLSEIYKNRRDISEVVLKHLGLKRVKVVYYTKVA